jgi:hypothetical protein
VLRWINLVLKILFIFPSKIFWNRFGRVYQTFSIKDGVGVDELKEAMRKLYIFNIDLFKVEV